MNDRSRSLQCRRIQKTKAESACRGVCHTQSYARRLWLVDCRSIVRTSISSIRHRGHYRVLSLNVVRGRSHGSLVAQMYAMNSNSAIGFLSLNQLASGIGASTESLASTSSAVEATAAWLHKCMLWIQILLMDFLPWINWDFDFWNRCCWSIGCLKM